MTPIAVRALPLRWKVTLAALAPLLVILLLVALAAAWLINARIVDDAQQQIRHDLSAAREVVLSEQARIDAVVRFAARSRGVATVLAGGAVAGVAEELQQVRQREGLDLLGYLGRDGMALTSSGQLAPARELLERADLRQALAGTSFSGPVVLGPDALQFEDVSLLPEARIPLRPATAPGAELRGMLLFSATPVYAADGTIAGCLYGGILLNNNLSLVDRIRDILYGADNGSATLFLGKTRVATTIRLKSGERALGTSVSDEVAAAVLDRGETWLARARVIDEWYLTAYEPIRDPDGKPIGALYVGLLEAPFNALKQRASLLLLGLLALGCLLGYLLAHLIAGRIVGPIVELEESARRLAAGERDVALPQGGDDEIGRLTHSFSHMTDALSRNEEELNQLNRQLELKVNERTSALEAKSLELMLAEQELQRAEKLAAIGELASGVAHEINNPAAIIRGNIELLLAQLPGDHPAREEAAEALRQTERVSRITQSMLAFAREQVITPEQVMVNEIVEEVLAQVRHHQPVADVAIDLELDPGLPSIMADGERLRQVFTNIVVNALQALDGSGTLRVQSRVVDGKVEILFVDNGPGIAADIQEKVFNPFFTTKGDGTGLGLSVSYGIIKALKGSIDLQSRPGDGTAFIISLPIG